MKFYNEILALHHESKKLAEAERARLKQLGITLEKPDAGIVRISIEELMANECS